MFANWSLPLFRLGMGMTQEQAAAALHAAKMAQLSSLGQNFDKGGMMPSHFDMSKMNRQSPDMSRMQTAGGVTIEPTKLPSYDRHSADIRRDDSQPMDLGSESLQTKERNCRNESDNNGASNMVSGGNSSGEDEYGSDDDGKN